MDVNHIAAAVNIIPAPIWDGFKQILLDMLVFFHGWVGDYGVAIILLTAVMRILMIPIQWKQTKSMYELQKVQPRLKELQAKYKNDKEKQNEEIMKFYQENKVNPFGGCLPLLLQMPIFIALYQVLGSPAEATGPSFNGLLMSFAPAARAGAKRFWMIIPDLTTSAQAVYTAAAKTGFMDAAISALPYLIFVVLFGLSTWLPQYLMTTDPQQRRMGTYMAVMMLFFAWAIPAGVLVYYVTSSAWQVVQQIITQRVLARSEGE